MNQQKTIIASVLVVLGLITLLFFNPFAWNDGGERTVVQTAGGDQYVQFQPGIYFQGFFAKATVWPNQISVTYQAEVADFELEDNGIEVGEINVRFNDATTADVKGIVQFILPSTEKDMIFIHNTHRTPQSLVQKRLAPYTKECLQSSAQLMSSDKHYGGGRAQMAQDFTDQLQGGVYLLSTNEEVIYDSIEHEKKRIYLTERQLDKAGLVKRKQSSITEYGVTVADAAITDVDYEDKVDEKLVKIIDAVTKAAISRQDLMKAQQEALTAEAQGKKELVEIEYTTRKEQTKQVVQAQTKVAVAEQDKLEQKIRYEASILEAKKIKELAEANAYAKRAVMQADGALEQKLAAYKEVQQYWANAFSKYTGNVSPQIMTGNGERGFNAASNFAETMQMSAQQQLLLNMRPKPND